MCGTLCSNIFSEVPFWIFAFNFVVLRSFHIHRVKRHPLATYLICLIVPAGTRFLQEVLAAQGQALPPNRPSTVPQHPAPVSNPSAVNPRSPPKSSPRKSPLAVPRDPLGAQDSPTHAARHEGHISWQQKVTNPVASRGVALLRDREAIKLKEERCVIDDDDDERCNLSDGSELSLMKCGQCKQTFAQKNMLQVHVCPRMPSRPYKCSNCSESFSLPNELRTHVVTHANDKPFKCGYCSRTFAGATTLNNHIRTHTGERPFLCEKCGKSFTQASQLSKHQRVPHECMF